MNQDQKTSLYLIPTPIGNLGDITYRAVALLRQVDTILAEDTRTSGILLNHYQIQRPLKSFHAHNEHHVLDGLVKRMEAGEVIALLSDAGTPGISDPGFLLVRACLNRGLKVECLPGATAFVPALIKSGLPTDRFTFEGFLPHKKGRLTLLKKLSDEARTMIFYESPYRLIKTLEQFAIHFGEDRKASVSRELTKIYEETITGSVRELISHFQQKQVKGELVIVVEGTRDKKGTDTTDESTDETETIH